MTSANRRRSSVLLIVGSVVLAAGPGCGGSGRSSSGPDPGAGKKAFITAGCGRCHALSAAATRGRVGPSLDSKVLPFRRVVKLVRDGGADMPAYAQTLTPDEIADIAAFVSRAGR